MSEKLTVKDILEIVVVAVVLSFILRTFVIDPRYVPSTSMVPTLLVNDRLFFDKIVYKMTGLERGDVVMLDPPEELGEKEQFVKRIIGLPGEELEVRDGLVYINGEAIDEPYIASEPRYSYGPVTIPDDAYIVFGDNRNSSSDSHVWGFLPQENVKGRAVFRFYPLSRIGLIE